MKAGIIAAGEGRRLAGGGVAVPKPLVQVAGETLLGRAIREAARAGAERVAVIANPAFPEVAAHLKAHSWPVPVDLRVWASPNSLESFLALKPLLQGGPFLLLTVDAVLTPGALAAFVRQARQAAALGSLGITAFKEDDEHPLFVELDDYGRILAVGRGPSPWVTAGCYFFQPQVFQWEDAARRRHLDALRQFLALLVEEGFPLWGIDMGPCVDVDYPEDIARAEALLKEKAVAWDKGER
ncbi:MAG: NTP transferase domain-containing protein [Deltaproteobacteria bacterium]|nr:NTP transferase domain-containing protein [Deltaproteobacteria bacterium]